jgi:uncharacterized delta-60 repeat protein
MTRRWTARAISSLCLLVVLSGAASAATLDGRLDPNFGNGGKVQPGMQEGRAVAIQANGKIVVVGSAGQNRFGVARFLPDGSVDQSFGGGDGESLLWFHAPPDGCFGGFNDVVIQPDAKIVAVGAACGMAGIARFLPDGTLDPAFGDSGSMLTPVSKEGDRAEANAVTLQSDGRIVVAGAQPGPTSNPAVIRYNPDGTLDTTFHGDGTLVSNVPGSAIATDVRVDAEGRLWIAGPELLPSAADPAPMVARYLPRGRLDPGFDGDGVTQLPGRTLGTKVSLALDASGAPVVAATIVRDFVVARLTPDGSLDPAFSGDGVMRTSLTRGCCDRPLDLLIQPDGKIDVVAEGATGETLQDLLALARYTQDGRLDGTFGERGKVRTSFDFQGPIFSGGIGMAPNGDLIATGAGNQSGHQVLLMARYLSRS